MRKFLYSHYFKYSLMLLGILLLTMCKSRTQENVADQKRIANFPKEEISPEKLPLKDNFWIFLMVGQSNMAGRGLVEPRDTVPNKRILSINNENEWIIAKEPLHFYQPKLTGLDCGMEYARTLINSLGDTIYIGLLPCAVGGSSVAQWLNDSLFNNVKLFTNFKEKVNLAKTYGTIKGILWHQGETDALQNTVDEYEDRIIRLFENFRNEIDNDSLLIILGELGAYSESETYVANVNRINLILKHVATNSSSIVLVNTQDLRPKENDLFHLNADSQRKMGQRYAKVFLNNYSLQLKP